MKAAVIGVNGFLGQHLAHHLHQQGWEVHGYGRKARALIPLRSYKVIDLTSRDDIKNIDTEVDFIFYFSGVTGTYKAYDDYEKYIDVNEKGLLNILSLLRERKSKSRIIFPSTRLVYKGVESIPLKEEDEKEFKTIYALTKWFGEQVLQHYATYFNIPYTIYRICVPYGNIFNSQYSYGTIGFFLSNARAGKNITLYGDGSLKRTFTYVTEISSQIFQSVVKQDSVNKIYNITGETFSLKEVALAIAKKYEVELEYKKWPENDKLIESGDTIFDGSKIQQLINYKTRYTFSKWLQDLI